MSKQKSDIVRDKIIKARESGKKTIILTDSEACDLWSTLVNVESDIKALELNINQVLEQSFRNLKRRLKVSKEQVKRVRNKG